MLNMHEIIVGLDERSYPIITKNGVLDEAGEIIKQRFGMRRLIIITDENVYKGQGERLKLSLEKAGFSPVFYILPPGEATKSYPYFEEVVEAILAAKIERKDLIIAFGGGVVGDLTGFAASVVRRGVNFIQIPTSLLSQVDSSVGGKTGINSPKGKNLVGAFHQPILVLIDPTVLKTLSDRHVKAGYAEVVKYALINDMTFFEWLEINADKLSSYGEECAHIITTSCQHKADIVAEDEKEHGARALLNLGHTFGHALEALTGYSETLIHGEAIAIGMIQALNFSKKLGYCKGQDIIRVQSHFEKMGLPTHISSIEGYEFTAEEILEAMYQDKKVSDGALTFILTKGIGGAFIQKNVDPKLVLEFLNEDMKLSQTT